jgi:hypothetical protein
VKDINRQRRQGDRKVKERESDEEGREEKRPVLHKTSLTFELSLPLQTDRQIHLLSVNFLKKCFHEARPL